jgi:ABC-type transport system involved in multi-copper enzyme maturation permease subunit
MSSTPPATTDPTPPAPAPLVETAPSALLAQGPAFARVIGFVGLFAAVLGAVVIITTRAVGPRWVSEGWGFVFAGIGLALMLYHAVTDGEQEVRRLYGGLAAGLLVLGVVSALLPGPFDAAGSGKQTGYYLFPWGLGAGFLALMFAVPFTRHETDDVLRNAALNALLGVGGLLCVGVVVFGAFRPEFLAGTGLALAVLGLGFVCAYLSQTGTDDGLGYTVAFALGALGAATLLYAFGRTAFPTVLFEGPSVLRRPNQTLDPWKAAGRGLVVLVFLGLVVLGAVGKFPTWLRATLAVVGLVGAGVFALASFKAVLTTPPQPFLVPAGLILGGIGLVYLAVGLGACSDNQFVTLTRRELAAYFVSPIGYVVLGGMALVEWYGYKEFYEELASVGMQGGGLPEPIVRWYFFALIPVIAVIMQVPAITMRLLAEERRTGSLEVLLTSPVSETPVVLSKFLSTWLFFLVCWLPAGLFLVALRMEAGQPFDYRPLLSFYLALAVCGAVFVSVGLFFSALTSNQIVAAVLTFAVMLLLLICFWVKRGTTFGPVLKAFLTRLSYVDLWMESLNGQLPVRDLVVWASAAVFFLFLSVKTLEARKWS